MVVGSVEEKTCMAVLSHTTIYSVEGKPERHPELQSIPLQCDEHQ